MSFWTRGNWAGGKYPPWVVPGIAIVLNLMMLCRGLDYGFGDAPVVARNLSAVEQFMPLTLWGGGFVIFMALAAVGMALRWAGWLSMAHLLSATLYLALASGVADAAIRQSFDGIRNTTILIGVGVIHLLLALGENAMQRQSDIANSLNQDEVDCGRTV